MIKPSGKGFIIGAEPCGATAQRQGLTASAAGSLPHTGTQTGGVFSRKRSHDANIDALKRTRRSAMQNSWIWALLLAMALCAALAFFLIEVWQLVEFVYR